MTITPKFKVDQDDDFVTIRINVPYIRISAAEILTENNEFSFYCKPYLLKLTFPGNFHEDEDKYSAQYNPDDDHGMLTVKLMKRISGEHFPDLDLITKLLQIRKVANLEERLDGEGGIEVLHSENFVDGDTNSFDNIESYDKVHLNMVSKFKYGFNNQYSTTLMNLSDQLLDMVEIEQPENIHPLNRRYLRVHQENKLFDANRYLGDLFGSEDDEIYQQAISLEPFWIEQWRVLIKKEKDSDLEIPSNVQERKQKWREESFQEIGGFTDQEEESLTSSIKRKEHLIKPGSQREFSLLMGLADILFAYCYDIRLTGGETTVESASNVARLSCVLSWLDSYEYPVDNLEAVIKFSMRRLVVYPFLRVWKLGRKVLTDVVKVLLLGKRTILKCLLQLRNIFEHTDTHYLLNKLFIDDYCVWIQNVQDDFINKFAIEYNNAKNFIEKQPYNGKELMGFNLELLEKWAREGCEDDSIPPEYLDYDYLIYSCEHLKYLQISPNSLQSIQMVEGTTLESQDEKLSLVHVSRDDVVAKNASAIDSNIPSHGPLIQVISSLSFSDETHEK